MQHIAIYTRVSTTRQDIRSQEPDLRQWVQAFANGDEVCWYTDSATGRNMDRPGWQKLQADIRGGRVSKLACWRLDRLGRSASKLTALFDELVSLKVGFVSLRDGVDLGTPAGRLVAGVLASVACYEGEVRSERVAAGQAAARAAGKQWGGSKPGRRVKVTPEQIDVIRRLNSDGATRSAIARAVALSRPTIYAILRQLAAESPASVAAGTVGE